MSRSAASSSWFAPRLPPRGTHTCTPAARAGQVRAPKFIPDFLFRRCFFFLWENCDTLLRACGNRRVLSCYGHGDIPSQHTPRLSAHTLAPPPPPMHTRTRDDCGCCMQVSLNVIIESIKTLAGAGSLILPPPQPYTPNPQYFFNSMCQTSDPKCFDQHVTLAYCSQEVRRTGAVPVRHIRCPAHFPRFFRLSHIFEMIL
jgi:hypothetical protein